MPVSVLVPSRLRVDPQALEERGPDVEEAYAEALAAVLRNVSERVLDLRGGYVGLMAYDPEFTWTGDGVTAVSPRARRELEDAIRDRIAGALDELRRTRAAVTSGPAVSTADAKEPVDEQRYDRVLRAYGVPSYDKGGKKVQVPVVPAQDEPPGDDFTYVLRTVGSIPELLDAIDEMVDWRGAKVPKTGFTGAVYRHPSGKIGIFVAENPGGNIAIDASFDEPKKWELDDAGKWQEVQGSGVTGNAYYTLTWIGPAGDKAADTLRAFYGDRLRAMLREKAKSLETLKADEAEGWVERRFQELIDLRAKAVKSDVVGGVAFSGGGVDSLLWLTAGQMSLEMAKRMGTVDLVSITDEQIVVKTKETAGGGEPGGGGKGGPGGKGAPGGKEGGTGEGPKKEGGFVVGEPGEESEEGTLFPPVPPGSDQLELQCTSFEGEPALQDLGEAGKRIRQAMATVARRLGILECDYAGTFLINAATVMKARAQNIALWDTTEKAKTQAAKSGEKGNLGSLHFTPAPSLQIQFLRHLASTAPYITTLEQLVFSTYRADPSVIKESWRAGDAVGWELDFLKEFTPSMREATGWLFEMACQVLFLQLLNSSKDAIDTRLNNIDQFAAQFERAILPQLRTIDEMLRMQELLGAAATIAYYAQTRPGELKWRWPDVRIATASPVSKPVPRAASWRQAAASFTDSLTPAATAPEAAPARADHYELVPQVDGSYRILDKDGHVWSSDELEQGILLRRGAVESVEPLVKQFTDLPDVMERLRRPNASVKEELKSILAEMSWNNADIQAKARGDVEYGFKASRISESLDAATIPGTAYALGGIHLLAHQQIGEFFHGDWSYAAGVDYVFSAELGKEALISFIEFTGIVLLAVLCPPLAVDVGIAVAAYHYAEAKEHEEVYKALIDPEQVRSRAEIEAELFGAELGLALSFLPVAGELAGEARAALRVAEEVGEEAAAAGGRVAATGAEAAMAHLAKVIEQGFVETFVKELAKAWIINKAIGLALSPIIEGIQERTLKRGPVGGVNEAIQRLEAIRARRRGGK